MTSSIHSLYVPNKHILALQLLLLGVIDRNGRRSIMNYVMDLKHNGFIDCSEVTRFELPYVAKAYDYLRRTTRVNFMRHVFMVLSFDVMLCIAEELCYDSKKGYSPMAVGLIDWIFARMRYHETEAFQQESALLMLVSASSPSKEAPSP